MRTVENINSGWQFICGDTGKEVCLPHCFNALDGQDGSGMFRGEAVYERDWILSELDANRVHFLEIGGAELTSTVSVNGNICHRDTCGFSLYRVNITDFIHVGSNRIRITVSNRSDKNVYPGMADFSFYGGLYRDVNIICDDAVHFAENDGSRDGLRLIPTVQPDGTGTLRVCANAEGAGAQDVLYIEITDMQGNSVARIEGTALQEVYVLTVPNVRLWQGRENPYLYRVTVSLCGSTGTVWDERTLEVGFRTLSYTPEGGLLLNGKPYQLRGVAKHQDFGGIGNAITMEHMRKDLSLILEMGANAVRCSHYQHCDEWYTLCDRAGLLVWAEIPLISCVVQTHKADDNAKQQLTRLIMQAGNHCCVFCWGIQNELGIASKNPYAFALVKELADYAKTLDSTRMTAQANEYRTENDCPITYHTDILGYNLYYGWYYGEIPDLQNRLDEIHAVHLQTPLILTEYGVDTNPQYHSAEPKPNQYCEEYQLAFCANAIEAVAARPYMMGSFAWVMFDFGSAGRNEGGKPGQNQKGLVTIDRKVKKDAFYLYKASWSAEKTVYLAGKRFRNRTGETTDITVLSNAQTLELSVNGKVYARKDVNHAMTVFEQIPMDAGECTISVSGVYADATVVSDSMVLHKVEVPDPAYVLPPKKEEETLVVNWFDVVKPDALQEDAPLRDEGFTFEDVVGDILKHPQAAQVFMKYFEPLTKSARFESSKDFVTVNRLLHFVRRQVTVPDAVKRQCERELNAIDK